MNSMKKKFEIPEAIIVSFTIEDIITGSAGDGYDPSEDEWWWGEGNEGNN